MFEVANLNLKEERKKYSELICSLRINNPYYLLDYFQVFNEGFDNLICFEYLNEHASIIMPGYLKNIVIDDKKSQYFDFITPYGYSGPLFAKNTPDEEIAKFWKCVDEWYVVNGVVSEFIRFNLDGNERMYTGTIIPTLLNVKGMILEEMDQWNQFEYKVRKNIRKAQRENLSSTMLYQNEISIGEIRNFYNIYIATMKRTNAEKKFYYQFEDFVSFIHGNPENSAICNIYYNDQAISSELLLVSHNSFFSFLGGTNELFFDKRPNDYLKFMVINCARDTGRKYYVLGGGYGSDDGIFKYKKSFFPRDLVYYNTGRKIIDSCIYYQLFKVNNELRLNKGMPELDIEDKSFFPIYNKI